MSSYSSLETKISTRTPDEYAAFNEADQIEHCMLQDGHQTWGFVIYRCTYSSDANWEIFLSAFKDHIRGILETANGLDILERLEMTVFDDPGELDGASTAVARNKFREWSADKDTDEGKPCQRFRFCIHVDEDCLQSVVRASADPNYSMFSMLDHGGFVNLIWKRWQPYIPRHEADQEPLEGVTLKYVGWMRVALKFVVGIYCLLRDEHMWESEYKRPPAVAAV